MRWKQREVLQRITGLTTEKLLEEVRQEKAQFKTMIQTLKDAYTNIQENIHGTPAE